MGEGGAGATTNLWRSIHPVLLLGTIISRRYYGTKQQHRFSIKCTATASPASPPDISSKMK